MSPEGSLSGPPSVRNMDLSEMGHRGKLEICKSKLCILAGKNKRRSTIYIDLSFYSLLLFLIKIGLIVSIIPCLPIFKVELCYCKSDPSKICQNYVKISDEKINSYDIF